MKERYKESQKEYILKEIPKYSKTLSPQEPAHCDTTYCSSLCALPKIRAPVFGINPVRPPPKKKIRPPFFPINPLRPPPPKKKSSCLRN